MEKDTITKQPESSMTQPQEQNALQQQAMTLFQCKDGSLVQNPRDCRQPMNSILPDLSWAEPTAS